MKNYLLAVTLAVGAILSACTSGPATPDEFLRAYYAASENDPDKAVSMMDSATLPPGDGNAKTFIVGMAKITQTQYKSHGGIASIDDIKTWIAKRDPKYTGYSLSLRFKDGVSGRVNGYLVQEKGQWRMTTAANQG